MSTSRHAGLMQKIVRSTLCVLILAGNLSGQHDHSRIGYVPRDILSRPIPLRVRIGVFHEAVTTSSPLAQKFYDQGQAYLHSYMWIEAARSFHEVLRLDRKLAMAYVGLSYAYSPIDYAAAQDAVASAGTLTAGISSRETQRIEIRRLQLQAMAEPQNPTKFAAFRAAIDDALRDNPEDVELLLLRGNAEEPTPFGDGQGCIASAISYYQQVLNISPQNFAAHHYLAHCYENTGTSAEALEHAREYARLAPAAPHALHMLGHELRRNGQIAPAITQFRHTDLLETDYARSENIPAFLNWHHAHNLGLLAECYQSLGQMKSAEATLRKEVELMVFTDYAMLARSNWAIFLLTRRRSTAAKRAAEAMQELPSPLAQVAGYALAGQADLFLDDRVQASQQLQLAEMTAAGLSPLDAAAVRPYVLSLSIELQLVAQEAKQASAGTEKLISIVQATNNPDAWGLYEFQLELLAAFAREHDAWQIAETASQAMLDHDPAYAGAHFAMAMVAQHKKDYESAEREFAAAANLWKSADPGLSELTYIRNRRRQPQHRASSQLQNVRSPSLP